MKRLTQSQKIAARTARANKIGRELAGVVGSPFRIHEAVERKSELEKIRREQTRRMNQGESDDHHQPNT